MVVPPQFERRTYSDEGVRPFVGTPLPFQHDWNAYVSVADVALLKMLALDLLHRRYAVGRRQHVVVLEMVVRLSHLQ